MPAATVTTTVAVAYMANIGVTRRPRWSHRSKATTKIHQATPSFPRPAGWGRVPTGFSSGAPCPYQRRESRVVQPNELLLNGVGHQGRLFPRPITTKAIHEGVLMQCGRRRQLLKPPVSQADRPRSGAPEAATRLQVRLRVGRLTLGLTVADRWESIQATGLPAWRH